MTFPNLVRLNRQRWVALTLGVVLLTSSCGAGAAETAPRTGGSPAATEPAESDGGSGRVRTELDEAEDLFRSTVGESYTFTFEFVSSVTAEAGPISIDVVGGRVGAATYPDAMTRQVLPEIPMLTVADFFDRARSVLAGGGEVEVALDPSYGYPLTMTLDAIPDAIDDEMSVRITSLDPTGESPEGDGY